MSSPPPRVSRYSTASVIVVGAGWAGLAAAVTLALNGHTVLVLEAAPIAGGRARSLQQPPYFDNGQHLLLGAYSSMLGLLQTIGVSESAVLERRRLSLAVWAGSETITLNAPALPAPWHAACAMLNGRGLSKREKLQTMWTLYRWRHNGFQVVPDCTVAQWLADQPERVVRMLWEPLCVAALSTPIERASAAMFARVLRDAFTGARAHSDLLFAARPLSEIFPTPAERFITARGGSVRYGARVSALVVEEGQIRGVRMGDEQYSAQHVVLAVSAEQCLELLQPHAACAAIVERVEALESEAICTVYAEFEPSVRLNQPLTGMVGGVTQWVFDHSYWHRPGVVALVNSGNGPHVAWPKEQLAQTMLGELRAVFPNLPPPQTVHVYKEKRAALSCTPQSNACRPEAVVPIRGLWLAGDFTATGYPSTLEGAVRSGVTAADLITADLIKESVGSGLSASPA